MIKLGLHNGLLARMLHAALFDRISKFVSEYTPEGMGDVVASGWLSRLYGNDPTLHILVDLDDRYQIIGHAVLEIQETCGVRVAICHQVQGEKNSVVALAEGMEYLEKLATESNASHIVVYVAKNSKALEKRYGFTTVRTVLMKTVGGSTDE